MRKYTRMLLFTLLIILSIQQIAFAADNVQKTPKPTEGIESADPNHGSSKDIEGFSPESIEGLLINWYCDIYNTGTDLYLTGSNTTAQSVSEMKRILYLQKWNGSAWVDINYWTFNGYNTAIMTKNASADYQHENYYRVRAEHYAKNGLDSDTRYSTSSYIYIP